MKPGCGISAAKANFNVLCEDILLCGHFVEPSSRVNPPKFGPKPEDLDWGLSKEAGGAREEVQMAFVAKVLGYASINCTKVFPEMAKANFILAGALARVEYIWYLYLFRLMFRSKQGMNAMEHMTVVSFVLPTTSRPSAFCECIGEK